MERICSECKQPKDLEADFYREAKRLHGRGYRCKECSKRLAAERYACDPEKTLRRGKKHRDRNRQFVLDHYKEHPCVDCGEDDPVVLEFDHVHGKKKRDISKLANNTCSLKVIEDEIAKCEVVCSNCHRRRTAATQGWFSDVQ